MSKVQLKEVEKQNNDPEQGMEMIGMVLGALKTWILIKFNNILKVQIKRLERYRGLLEMFQGSQATKEEPPKQEMEQRNNPFMFKKRLRGDLICAKIYISLLKKMMIFVNISESSQFGIND